MSQYQHDSIWSALGTWLGCLTFVFLIGYVLMKGLQAGAG